MPKPARPSGSPGSLVRHRCPGPTPECTVLWGRGPCRSGHSAFGLNCSSSRERSGSPNSLKAPAGFWHSPTSAEPLSPGLAHQPLGGSLCRSCAPHPQQPDPRPPGSGGRNRGVLPPWKSESGLGLTGPGPRGVPSPFCTSHAARRLCSDCRVGLTCPP